MALCGFNKDMLKGLELFHTGLVRKKTSEESKERKNNLEES
jgi:hypothetical protein